MYEDTEDTSDTDTKDFFNALALLHSTEDDSADKLRKMLDACIEKKLGFDKTIRARVPKRSYRNTILADARVYFRSTNRNVSPLVDNIKNDWGRMKILNGQVDTEPNGGEPTKTLDNTRKTNYKLFESFDEEEIEVDDSNERDDIPRISIPDEGLGDGLLCKVCNGTKLGPLILLECQDCQEAYHPLCHQPPVVDVDVYDPRIVWYCNNCIDDTASTDHDAISTEKRTKKDRRDDTSKTKESSVNAVQFIEIKESLSKNFSTIFEKSTSDTVREIDDSTSSSNDQVISRDSSPLFVRKTKSLSSNQLKKRIGSKLSVARTVTKQS